MDDRCTGCLAPVSGCLCSGAAEREMQREAMERRPVAQMGQCADCGGHWSEGHMCDPPFIYNPRNRGLTSGVNTDHQPCPDCGTVVTAGLSCTHCQARPGRSAVPPSVTSVRRKVLWGSEASVLLRSRPAGGPGG